MTTTVDLSGFSPWETVFEVSLWDTTRYDAASIVEAGPGWLRLKIPARPGQYRTVGVDQIRSLTSVRTNLRLENT